MSVPIRLHKSPSFSVATDSEASSVPARPPSRASARPRPTTPLRIIEQDSSEQVTPLSRKTIRRTGTFPGSLEDLALSELLSSPTPEKSPSPFTISHAGRRTPHASSGTPTSPCEDRLTVVLNDLVPTLFPVRGQSEGSSFSALKQVDKRRTSSSEILKNHVSHALKKLFDEGLLSLEEQAHIKDRQSPQTLFCRELAKMIHKAIHYDHAGLMSMTLTEEAIFQEISRQLQRTPTPLTIRD